jgi:hypothetical protein
MLTGFLHPFLIRMSGDSGDVHTPTSQHDKGEYVIDNQPPPTEHLDGEEVALMK